jgi:hypothetical protein
MERRNFLKQLIGGVAAVAAVRTFPFRVFSFPSEPKLVMGPWLLNDIHHISEWGGHAIDLNYLLHDMPPIPNLDTIRLTPAQYNMLKTATSIVQQREQAFQRRFKVVEADFLELKELPTRKEIFGV